MDKYANYHELKQGEREGKDYRISVRESSSASVIAVIAPHGGRIEPGATEIADKVAGTDYLFYSFEGLKPTGNARLHIASVHFDEPRAVKIVNRADVVLAVHGCEGNDEVVYVGGLHNALKEIIRTCLIQAGFRAEECPKTHLAGKTSRNICNRGRTGQGVQLEISKGLRTRMFINLKRQVRDQKTEVFHLFVRALRLALSKLVMDSS